MTATYEERLWLFARGKRLRRFRGLLRAPRVTFCDACGSSLPSHLYGLRDMDEKQDYFVGANCMARLSQMLVLERPFVKADIVSAYALARNIPEKLKLPHQPDLESANHPCCIHGRNGHADNGRA
jgi:hypothetical protein